MKTLTISLPEETADRMEEAARRLGLSPEALVQSSLQEKLDRLDLDFDAAAEKVLSENAELYRRLA